MLSLVCLHRPPPHRLAYTLIPPASTQQLTPPTTNSQIVFLSTQTHTLDIPEVFATCKKTTTLLEKLIKFCSTLNTLTFNSVGMGYLKHAECAFIRSERTLQDFSGVGSPGTATSQYSLSDMFLLYLAKQSLLSFYVSRVWERGWTCDDHAMLRARTVTSRNMLNQLNNKEGEAWQLLAMSSSTAEETGEYRSNDAINTRYMDPAVLFNNSIFATWLSSHTFACWWMLNWLWWFIDRCFRLWKNKLLYIKCSVVAILCRPNC